MKLTTLLMGAAAAVALAPAAFAERGADGEVRIIYWQAPSILNPFLSGGTKDVESASMIIEPLARFNETGELVPWLVEEVPTVSNGGVSEDLTSITWNITPGLTWSDGSFDAVLLDAPCSATGTIRRHPDLPHAKRDLDLAPLLALQAGFIDRALALLAPGGRVVFCTCSLLPEEGEAQIEAALARHPGLAVDPVTMGEVPGLDPAWLRADGTLRITPETWAERGGIDGFYIARLERAVPRAMGR